MAPTYVQKIISPAEREKAATHHTDRLAPILDPYLEKRSRGHKNPIMDFLFEYYSFAPARLQEWSPGFGVAISDSTPDHLPNGDLFTRTADGVTLDPEAFPADRLDAARWIRQLLHNTQQQSPFFGCHGLHEWAMVYRADNIRHERVPLRMDEDELAAFVESQPIACTHFDAFRFFTSEARPMNTFHPSHEQMPDLEQPGCIHTNMDVYRWAFKFYPWIPSDLIADAFLNACYARKIDMRASPYDLREYGLEPIRIQTKEGREQYRGLQRKIFEEAKPLRERLLQTYDYLLAQVGN